MKEYVKKLKFTSFLLGAGLIVLGICLIIWPKTSELATLYIIGALLMLAGVFAIIEYFLYGYEPFGFLSGAMYIGLGILICICAQSLTSASVFGFIVGLSFVINSLFEIQNSFDYRRFGAKLWWLATLFSVIELALGIVILVNPFVGENALLMFLGAVFIYEGITMIIKTSMISSSLKKIKHKFSDLFKVEDVSENV